MGNNALVYKQKAIDNLAECNKHLARLNGAFDELQKTQAFPLEPKSLKAMVEDVQMLAFCDQVIYRFSKLQDCIDAKLFKSVLLYHGETVNKPILDILNHLEQIDIINVDDWFEMRDLRNEIAHDYDDNDEHAMNIINAIFRARNELEHILTTVDAVLK